MQIPFNMTVPRLKLNEGEQLVVQFPLMRKKGIFGNRFGELVFTNQRVVFVKAIMKGVVAMAVNAKGANPMLTFERSGLRADKLAAKKTHLLQLTSGVQIEKFMASDEQIAGVLTQLGQ